MRTHCYVGCLPCGCGAAIVVDDSDYAADTGKDVGAMVARGLVVQRVPIGPDDSGALFLRKCAAYPHEAWQVRNEASRARKRAS